jgi:catechol 2,3-dioxygenase-like lactoylglutathione lyase family enzyme
MESSELDLIEHFAINVKNIDLSVKWYQSSFKCNVVKQTETFALLQFANIKLALSLPSQQPGHLAFLRKDADTFGELRLQADDSLSTFLADPTGNMVEIISDK